MRLNGWTWLISGLIVTIMSGYVYLFIPKNGEPNTAMALFFFIGVVFLIVGVTQLFFKRKDDKSVMDSIDSQPQEQKIVTMPAVETKQNKVEVAVEQLLQQRTQEIQPQNKSNAQMPMNHQVIQPHTSRNPMQHSNSFVQMYQYKGPVHTPSTGTHAGHPVSQHIQQQNVPEHHATAIHNTPHTISHQLNAAHESSHPDIHHPVQNTTEHSIKCSKCGNVNPGHSNYCHKCGNRLK